MEFAQEPKPKRLVKNIEVDKDTTLSVLIGFLQKTITKEKRAEISQAIIGAKKEIRETGQLSQGTLEYLDNLPRTI